MASHHPAGTPMLLPLWQVTADVSFSRNRRQITTVPYDWLLGVAASHVPHHGLCKCLIRCHSVLSLANQQLQYVAQHMAWPDGVCLGLLPCCACRKGVSASLPPGSGQGCSHIGGQM